MPEKYYTTMNIVADDLVNHYNHHRKFCDFSNSITRLYTKKQLSPIPIKFHRSDHFLSLEEFRNHLYSQVIYADLILENEHPSVINESNTIPDGKDIYTIVHLPFQNPIWHKQDFFEIVFIYSGSCTLEFEKTTQRFFSGDFVLISPGSMHRIIADEGSAIPGIYLRQSTFDQTFWQLLNNEDLLSAFFKHSLYGTDSRNYLFFHIQKTKEYHRLVQQIFDETNVNERYSNQIAISLMNVFFGKMLRDYGNNITLHENPTSSKINADFPMILRYTQSNYATITLPALAEVFHYSEAYISTMFRKNLNQKFSILLQELKLKHAKEYLLNTSDSIYVIAERIGYNSVDHFSRVFKKKYQVSPSEYRKTFLTEK